MHAKEKKHTKKEHSYCESKKSWVEFVVVADEFVCSTNVG